MNYPKISYKVLFLLFFLFSFSAQAENSYYLDLCERMLARPWGTSVKAAVQKSDQPTFDLATIMPSDGDKTARELQKQLSYPDHRRGKQYRDDRSFLHRMLLFWEGHPGTRLLKQKIAEIEARKRWGNELAQLQDQLRKLEEAMSPLDLNPLQQAVYRRIREEIISLVSRLKLEKEGRPLSLEEIEKVDLSLSTYKEYIQAWREHVALLAQPNDSLSPLGAPLPPKTKELLSAAVQRVAGEVQRWAEEKPEGELEETSVGQILNLSLHFQKPWLEVAQVFEKVRSEAQKIDDLSDLDENSLLWLTQLCLSRMQTDPKIIVERVGQVKKALEEKDLYVSPEEIHQIILTEISFRAEVSVEQVAQRVKDLETYVDMRRGDHVIDASGLVILTSLSFGEPWRQSSPADLIQRFFEVVETYERKDNEDPINDIAITLLLSLEAEGKGLDLEEFLSVRRQFMRKLRNWLITMRILCPIPIVREVYFL
ncbi:MAG: hypothetical protein HYY62_00030 [Deltaproteobacteria bacterium]|nr:hypothetical protein [Deltaproteobacteria bacterium]